MVSSDLFSDSFLLLPGRQTALDLMVGGDSVGYADVVFHSIADLKTVSSVSFSDSFVLSYWTLAANGPANLRDSR